MFVENTNAQMILHHFYKSYNPHAIYGYATNKEVVYMMQIW